MKRVRKASIALLAGLLLFGAAGSGCYHVKSDEVAVRVINFPLVNGLSEKAYGQGRHLYLPYLMTYYKMPTTIRALEMVQEGEHLLREAEKKVLAPRVMPEPEEGSMAQQEAPAQKAAPSLQKQSRETKALYQIVIHERPTKDQSVRVKTADGNDAWVDIIITYRVDPSAPWKLVRNFEMRNGLEVVDQVVESMTRSVVRSKMAALDSNQVLNAATRAEAARTAEEELREELGKLGVQVVKLSAPAVTIHPDFEKILNQKRVAEEERDEYISYRAKAEQELFTKVNKARGEALSKVEMAKGRFEKTKQEADAEYEAMKLKAEALERKYKELAEGIAAQTRELARAGGENHVGLKIAEALQGKKIIIVPGQGAFNLLDLNEIIQTYAAAKVLSPSTSQNSNPKGESSSLPE